ncbi:phosphatidate cytidylyltransferase [Puniceicoccales bacterium CK1056]|uniref:Phosphatidate cytidylyltransferase n=1 Tax=Oceanipulchritudo coccoides TaxID=2706888 RepID=A0A6B2M2W7_9BACT|nr:phosphatidate cytidylyltransferase [Oceanipulchritudo coccoides]NDV63093.1 phosphatidate cytidylyltransferase [Oceanipulchritudo coccoides]
MNDPGIHYLVGGVLIFLTLASLITALLWRLSPAPKEKPVLQNLASRIRAWWVMVIVFAIAILIEPMGTILLFAFISFLALREFITLTPTRAADYKALAPAFFLVIPVNYLLIWIEWYGFYVIFIPVWVLAFIPLLSAIGNDLDDFLERSSEIQWGILVCIYFLSHVPALLILDFPGYAGSTSKLLLFFVIIVQASDVLQYIWGKSLGKHAIVPKLSPSKTWEGFIGGVGSATLLGTLLWWATPFEWWQASILSFTICLFGFWGGLIMSAIKRDRGIKDYGGILGGHGGILDRVDSLCFSAPIFFHLVRFYFT